MRLAVAMSGQITIAACGGRLFTPVRRGLSHSASGVASRAWIGFGQKASATANAAAHQRDDLRARNAASATLLLYITLAALQKTYRPKIRHCHRLDCPILRRCARSTVHQ